LDWNLLLKGDFSWISAAGIKDADLPGNPSPLLPGLESESFDRYIWPAIQSFEGPASSAFFGEQSLLHRYYGVSWILVTPQRPSMEANKFSRKEADKLPDLKYRLHY